MPEITRFYGIIIKIYFSKEHNPPHFHAIYGNYTASFRIDTLEMLEGDLPNTAVKFVKQWAKKYNIDIMEMWNTKILKKLPPLR